jgi:lipopolysaccharide/colanic/teichoic acid biosynthesis glycosyltransferase
MPAGRPVGVARKRQLAGPMDYDEEPPPGSCSPTTGGRSAAERVGMGCEGCAGSLDRGPAVGDRVTGHAWHSDCDRSLQRGPTLFRRVREGYCGREFRIFKFRTMHSAVYAPTDRLVLASRKDDRTFPLSSLLRRTSLDQLPQLFNVLRGDMWLIGPRPQSPLATASEYRHADTVQGNAGRHEIKPGITSSAQINRWWGPTSTIEQRVAHDFYYINNWSPWFDFQLLLMTAIRSFVHQNAF